MPSDYQWMRLNQYVVLEKAVKKGNKTKQTLCSIVFLATWYLKLQMNKNRHAQSVNPLFQSNNLSNLAHASIHSVLPV